MLIHSIIWHKIIAHGLTKDSGIASIAYPLRDTYVKYIPLFKSIELELEAKGEKH